MYHSRAIKPHGRDDEEMNSKVQNSQNTINQSTYLLIITLNANGLKSLVKTQRVAEEIKKQTHIYVSYKRLLICEDTE